MKNVLASKLSDEAEQKLNELGYNVIAFDENKSIGENVGNHADMSFLMLSDNTIFIAKEMNNMKPFFESMGMSVIVNSDYLGKKYPYDVPLNSAVVGKYLICNVDTVSKYVLQYFSNNGSTIVNVKQGYTKCSVVPVDCKSVITDDSSVAFETEKAGLDVLLVSKGSVKLTGFNYGFIGGTAGRLGNNIVFNGDIKKHPDGCKIKSFIEDRNMNCISLCSDYLTDVGSIIPLGGQYYEKK